jgi:hypothetical protein
MLIIQQNTYAFLITIIKGEDYQGLEDVETVALYNESCNYNYISARFARYLLRNLGRDIDDIDGDFTLLWVCEALGRYQQRNVFWIAKEAHFDLLFGYEKDFNIPKHQDNQFQCGINNGTLKMEFPRKSFQGGILEDYLLPMGTSSDGFDGNLGFRMPSLVDIKIQLAAQLASSPERKRRHDLRRALNVYDPQPTVLQIRFSPEWDRCTASESDGSVEIHDASQQIETPTSKSLPAQEKGSEQSDTSTFKGTKRVRPDQNNTGVRCSCRCVAAAVTTPKVCSQGSFTDSKPASPTLDAEPLSMAWPQNSFCKDSVFQKICEESDDRLETIHPSSRSVSKIAEEEILLSGMDRIESCEKKVSRDNSSISLSSNDSGILGHRRESISVLVEDCDQQLPVNICCQEPKRRRRSGPESTESITTAAWGDRKFNEFWKWNAEMENWYHFDEGKKTTIWYKPPPWSTPSPIVGEHSI